MATIDRAVRRQRILKGSEDRLALISGRLQNLPSPSNCTVQSPPLVSRHRAPDPKDKLIDDAAQSYQNSGLASGGRKESFLHGHEANSKSWSVSSTEQLIPTLLNFFGSISSKASKQLSLILAATKQSRLVFSITLALLVLMSHFEFPFFGHKIISSVFLFRPLILLLLTDTTLIVVRLPPDMKMGEAGGILELSLMMHDFLNALFMDSIVYSLIIICGICLAS